MIIIMVGQDRKKDPSPTSLLVNSSVREALTALLGASSRNRANTIDRLSQRRVGSAGQLLGSVAHVRQVAGKRGTPSEYHWPGSVARATEQCPSLRPAS
jgi:hypothetical protein